MYSTLVRIFDSRQDMVQKVTRTLRNLENMLHSERYDGQLYTRNYSKLTMIIRERIADQQSSEEKKNRANTVETPSCIE